METRGDQLSYAIAFALRGVKVRGRAGTLSEDDRYATARLVVDKLRERGEPSLHSPDKRLFKEA